MENTSTLIYDGQCDGGEVCCSTTLERGGGGNKCNGLEQRGIAWDQATIQQKRSGGGVIMTHCLAALRHSSLFI